MSILDDAIRQHLELKRAHGADDAEIKRLEDEAFGPPQRPDEPDPLAEAPTEFLTVPEGGAEEQAGEEGGGRRVPNVADLQEAPEPPPAEADAPAPGESAGETEIDAGPSTEERQAIAAQPTELFDVEGEFEDAAAEADAPDDDDLADAERAEPRLAATAEEEEEPADEFDEFFSEQRLSEELNQALEAPLPGEPGDAVVEEEAEEEEAEVFADADAEVEDEEEAPEHEDVLEDTPEFLEESPEDDELWFEQKPPKDIDLGV